MCRPGQRCDLNSPITNITRMRMVQRLDGPILTFATATGAALSALGVLASGCIPFKTQPDRADISQGFHRRQTGKRLRDHRLPWSTGEGPLEDIFRDLDGEGPAPAFAFALIHRYYYPTFW